MDSKKLTIENNLIFCLILLFAVIFLYGNTLTHGFVWDDHPLIDENPYMKDAASIPGFFTRDFWMNSAISYNSGFYRPLTLLSFFINYQIWDGSPFGFHLFNILLHSVNALLIFFMFFYVTGDKFVSLITGLLFAIHPMQTETVVFISDAGDILCTFFVLLAALFYLRYAKDQNGKSTYVLSAVALALALLCKENAMVGFVLIMLIDLYFVSGLDWKAFREKMGRFIPYLAITAAYILIRVVVVGWENALTTLGNVRYVSLLPSYDGWSHILTVLNILLLYLKMFLAPFSQSVSYVMFPAVNFFSLETFLAVLSVVVCLLLIFLSFRFKEGWISFALAWFFITILPLSNLIPISNTIAERFMYLPSVGLCFLFARVFSLLTEKTALASAVKFAVVIGVVAFLSSKTVDRNHDWRSDFTIFTSALPEKPCAPIAHKNLSVYHYRQNDLISGSLEQRRYEACVTMIKDEYRRRKDLSRG